MLFSSCCQVLFYRFLANSIDAQRNKIGSNDAQPDNKGAERTQFYEVPPFIKNQMATYIF